MSGNGGIHQAVLEWTADRVALLERRLTCLEVTMMSVIQDESVPRDLRERCEHALVGAEKDS